MNDRTFHARVLRALEKAEAVARNHNSASHYADGLRAAVKIVQALPRPDRGPKVEHTADARYRCSSIQARYSGWDPETPDTPTIIIRRDGARVTFTFSNMEGIDWNRDELVAIKEIVDGALHETKG